MALAGLLLGLRRLHHWDLQLWHGDHGWHAGSAAIASELAGWCQQQQLPLRISQANVAGKNSQASGGEAEARRWRYAALAETATALAQAHPPMPCRRVVCAHSASDKAETLLLHIARGTDLAGLGSLRNDRALDAADDHTLRLVRPLLGFSRQETAAVCRDLNLPIWLDPSNADPRFSRNRIRQEVLPVLNDLHPGCEQRMAALSERLSQVQDTQEILLDLSLETLGEGPNLKRRRFSTLPTAIRRDLLARWLQVHGAAPLKTPLLEELARATAFGTPAGGRDLPNGWRIHWDKNSLQLEQRL